MVVYAMSVARTAPDVIPARIRIPSYAVWEVVVFLLNALAFILVGLQLKPIVRGLDRAALLDHTRVALAVCAAVILIRIVWAIGANFLRGPRAATARREAVVVAWCGMRGTVTLAAALALPADFPHRDLILLTSFLVVLGTLVVQGLTLKPLMARLGLEHDDAVEREVRLARVEALRAGAGALENSGVATEAAELLRGKYRMRLERAEARLGSERSGPSAANGERDYAAAARAAMAAERRRLSALRTDGTIGDDAFHKVEEELDRAELSAEAMDPED
jgi:CPA1 family monovalent cation:H+ antiporter